MSRKNNKKAPPFVMLINDYLDDPKTDKLLHSAFRVYAYARKKFNPKKPSLEFELTYIEMKRMMAKTTFSRAIHDLIEAKLIEQVKSGGFPRIKSRYKFIGEYRYFYLNGKRIG